MKEDKSNRKQSTDKQIRCDMLYVVTRDPRGSYSRREAAGASKRPEPALLIPLQSSKILKRLCRGEKKENVLTAAIGELCTGRADWCELSGEDSRGECGTERPAWSVTETNSVAPGNVSILITAQDGSSRRGGEPENEGRNEGGRGGEDEGRREERKRWSLRLESVRTEKCDRRAREDGEVKESQGNMTSERKGY